MRTTRNVAAVACALLALAGHAQAQKAITTGYMFWNKRAEGNDVLSAIKLNKLLNENLADAQQVNFFLDSCYSGAMVKIRWCARVRLFLRRGKELFFEQPFVLGMNAPAFAV